MMRFISNCRASQRKLTRVSGSLTVSELNKAVLYWVSISQTTHFSAEIVALKSSKSLPRSSPLISLNIFLDADGLLRVGGRQQNSRLSYDRRHPIILHGKHPVTKLLIHTEHLRLLHAGPLLISGSLGRRYHIVGGRRAIHSVSRRCVICRRRSLRPQPPLMGQLPSERVTPDLVFNRVGIDYAGPILTKYGYVRKPTLVKSYVCVFVSLSVKAVHLELVSDLTTEAFIKPAYDALSPGEGNHLSFSVTTGQTSLEHQSNSRICSSFFSDKSPSRSSTPFAPVRILNGSTFQREHLTSEVCGKLRSKASKNTSLVLWEKSSLPLRSC